jgi:endonuclease/exonuclease/phosphatase family metal-dependent hydrolase
MTFKKMAMLLVFVSLGFLIESVAAGQPPRLRLLTINVWTGLDYVGWWRMGEYESAEQREVRFRSLVIQLKRLDPDVIFLQEVNPVSGYASRLADSLSFDEIHQVCVAGIKFGPLGIPSNFKEGNAILARRSLNLRRHDVWKLSGSPGIFGDAITIHFDESIFALVGKITTDNTPMFLVNVHLVAATPIDSALQQEFSAYFHEGRMSKDDYESALTEWRENAQRQKEESMQLIERLQELPGDVPLIVAGDFNATPDAPAVKEFLRDEKFFDALDTQSSAKENTWDPSINTNIRFSTSLSDARADTLTPYGILGALFDARARKIDYILLGNHFKRSDVARSEIVIDSVIDGVCASDHFGIEVDIEMKRIAASSPKELSTVTPVKESTFEPLPIASYDTDAGFGYGAKAFLLNQLGLNESFDGVFFNSTKGERWYRLVFSLPDFELRQGKIFPLAVDLVIDYDKWITNSFFGIGNNSRFDDREYYTREPMEISLTFSKGFSPVFVAQGGLRFKSVRNFNFTDTSALSKLPPQANSGTATYQSLLLSARYDTRNSFINPSLGTVAQCEVEQSLRTSFKNSQFTRLSFSLQYYSILFYPTTVLALRCMTQGVIGSDLPVQVLSSIGGNSTLRGSPQDRYLDNISALFNSELRFPLYWRFGGVVGLDAAKVWHTLANVDIDRWASNPTAGLRFYMDTFVVRLDVGFGKETTGFYFNFGQIF